MTEEEKLNEAINIILENILTPIIYMYVDEVVEFIVFSDSETANNVFRRIEGIIYFNLGLCVEIIDIHEFDESDRADIAQNAHVVYSENDIMPILFERAMTVDMEIMRLAKQEVIRRKTDTGTYYMS